MRGLFLCGPLRGLHRLVLDGCLLVGLLLATQTLVPDLLAENHYNWVALAETCSVRVRSEHNYGRGVRLEDGMTIATCAHVVGTDKWVLVDGQEALVIKTDTSQDIAILRTDAPGRPFRVQWTVSPSPMGTGLVLAGKLTGREMQVHRTTVLNHTLDSNPVVPWPAVFGYSGGPAFTPEGELVGIIRGQAFTRDFNGTEIIPMYKVREVIDRARQELADR